MTPSLLVKRWLLEYACKHQYQNLLHRIAVSTVGGLESLGVPPVRLLSVTVLTVLTRHDLDYFDKAIVAVHSLYEAGRHCNTGGKDDVVPFRQFVKLSAGLKILSLFHHLKKANNEDGPLLAKLNDYFPRTGLNHEDCEPQLLKKLSSAQLKFRKFFLSLVVDGTRRHDYLRDQYADEFGGMFVERLGKVMEQFVAKIEKCLPETVIDKLLRMPPDAPLICELSRQQCGAFELLLDCLHSADGPRSSTISEHALLEILDLLVPPSAQSTVDSRPGHDGTNRDTPGGTQLRHLVLSETVSPESKRLRLDESSRETATQSTEAHSGTRVVNREGTVTAIERSEFHSDSECLFTSQSMMKTTQQSPNDIASAISCECSTQYAVTTPHESPAVLSLNRSFVDQRPLARVYRMKSSQLGHSALRLAPALDKHERPPGGGDADYSCVGLSADEVASSVKLSWFSEQHQSAGGREGEKRDGAESPRSDIVSSHDACPLPSDDADLTEQNHHTSLCDRSTVCYQPVGSQEVNSLTSNVSSQETRTTNSQNTPEQVFTVSSSNSNPTPDLTQDFTPTDDKVATDSSNPADGSPEAVHNSVSPRHISRHEASSVSPSVITVSSRPSSVSPTRSEASRIGCSIVEDSNSSSDDTTEDVQQRNATFSQVRLRRSSRLSSHYLPRIHCHQRSPEVKGCIVQLKKHQKQYQTASGVKLNIYS